MNLVILTTAITRGNFHERSIGKFYKLYNDLLKDFSIYHIINLDLPEKLKNTFTKKETFALFNEIIPKNVNVSFIDNDEPGFLNAYKNVVIKANTLDLECKNTLVWWFEDDWDVSNFNKDLFNIIKLFPTNLCYAFNSVINSPLGSFRGGPIMTFSYFKKYFDIVSNNVVNKFCDPERQVNRWVSGIKRRKTKKRNIVDDVLINIIFFYHNTSKISVHEIPNWYYNKKNKFNEKLIFKYHAIKSENLIDFYYSNVDFINKRFDFKKKEINEINELLNNKGINYIYLKPYIFSDIGRKFIKEFKLKKWVGINDGTSYI